MAQGRKLIAENRKARHDFHILERVEAGVALEGTEVKSLRDGGGNIREAFAQLREGEVFPPPSRSDFTSVPSRATPASTRSRMWKSCRALRFSAMSLRPCAMGEFYVAGAGSSPGSRWEAMKRAAPAAMKPAQRPNPTP